MVVAPPSRDDDWICKKGDGAEGEHDEEGYMVGPGSKPLAVEIGGGGPQMEVLRLVCFVFRKLQFLTLHTSVRDAHILEKNSKKPKRKKRKRISCIICERIQTFTYIHTKLDVSEYYKLRVDVLIPIFVEGLERKAHHSNVSIWL